MTVFEILREIAVEEFGLDPREFKPDASFRALGADSLEIASFLLSVEQGFDIEIPSDEAQRLMTVQDLLDYIQPNRPAA